MEGGINLFAYTEGNPVNQVDPEGLSFVGAVRGAVKGAVFGAAIGAVLGGTIGLAAGSITGPGALVAAGAGAAAGAYEGALLGALYGSIRGALDLDEDLDPCLFSKGKGERGWGKRRGDDPLWGETVEKLKNIEKNHPDPNVRENAKRIRKMKEKEKGKPGN